MFARGLLHAVILAFVLWCAIVYALVLAAEFAPSVHGAGRTCADFALEMSAESDDHRLHAMGCDQSRTGRWVADQGYCAKLARQFARKGIQGWDVAPYVSALAFKRNGYDRCTMHEDGTYSS